MNTCLFPPIILIHAQYTIFISAGTPNIIAGTDSDDEDDEETACTEIKFIPTDPMSLEPMYQALNECQALHPDPQDQSDDDAWPEGNSIGCPLRVMVPKWVGFQIEGFH